MVVSVGIDVSKDKHDCFIVSSEGEVLADAFARHNNSQEQAAFPPMMTLRFQPYPVCRLFLASLSTWYCERFTLHHRL